jgi:hypothetical protein
VPGQLHIRRVDPEHPASAAEAVARDIGAAAPHGREVCVLSVPRGRGPGLSVPPWASAGVQRAHEGATVHAQTLQLAGQLSGQLSVGGRTGPRATHAPARPHADALSLSWPGMARPLRVPHAWLGRRLVLLTPCVVTSSSARVHLGHLGHLVHLGHGPVAAAFEALALAAGAPSTGDPSGLGARIAAHVFAHVAVIVDASWSIVVDGRFERYPTARCIGVQAPCPTADGHAVRVRDIDAWLVRRLGLGASASAPALTLHGDPDPPRWIAGTPGIDALADREVAPLWHAPGFDRTCHGWARRVGPRPRQPDALDRAWAAWTEGRA